MEGHGGLVERRRRVCKGENGSRQRRSSIGLSESARETWMDSKFYQQSFNRRIQQGVAKAELTSLLFCSFPSAAAMTRLPYQVVFCLLAGAAIRCSLTQGIEYLMQGVHWAQEVKFVPLQLRAVQNTSLLSRPCIESFGLLHDGTFIQKRSSLSLDGADMILRFDNAVAFNGWYFTTSHSQPPALDPVKFVLMARSDGNWVQLGSSQKIHYQGTAFLLNGFFNTTLERGAMHIFDMRPPRWLVITILNTMQSGILCLLCTLCGAFGKQCYSRGLLYFSCLISGVLHMVEALACFLFDDDHRSAWLAVSSAGTCFILAVLMGWFKTEKICTFFTYAAVYRSVALACTLPFSTNGAREGSITVVHVCIFVPVALSIHIFRWRSLSRLRQLVRRDREKYEAAWEATLQEDRDALLRCAEEEKRGVRNRRSKKLQHPHFGLVISAEGKAVWKEARGRKAPPPLGSLAALRNVVRRIKKGCDDSLPRQMKRVNLHGNIQVVQNECLASVYREAVQINPLLRAKVAAWAAQCEGLFFATSKKDRPDGLSVRSPSLDSLRFSFETSSPLAGENGPYSLGESWFDSRSEQGSDWESERGVRDSLASDMSGMRSSINSELSDEAWESVSPSGAAEMDSDEEVKWGQRTDGDGAGGMGHVDWKSQRLNLKLLTAAQDGRLSAMECRCMLCAHGEPESELLPPDAAEGGEDVREAPASAADLKWEDAILFSGAWSPSSAPCSPASRSPPTRRRLMKPFEERAESEPSWPGMGSVGSSTAGSSDRPSEASGRGKWRERRARTDEEGGLAECALDARGAAEAAAHDEGDSRGCAEGLDRSQSAPPTMPAMYGDGWFVKWSACLAAGEEGKTWVRWPGLKRPGRTLEKVMRSYRSEISRVLDVCRQCIVFETLAELTRCLQLIHEDKEVTVERVKNRLDSSYDASQHFGYRDIALNIRLTSGRAAALGLQLHVMEVQLILMRFATLRSASGHSRYLVWRNALCQ